METFKFAERDAEILSKQIENFCQTHDKRHMKSKFKKKENGKQ